MRIIERTGIGLCGILLATASVLAQAAAPGAPESEGFTPPGRSPNYGLAGLSSWTASALEFSTFSQTANWQPVLGSPKRYLTSGLFEVPLHLPQGALVTSIEIEGCDDTAGGQLTALLIGAEGPGGPGLVIDSVTSGVANMPGCAYFSKAITPFTVDNVGNVYFFELNNTPTDGTTSFAAIRAYYQLQVSPAPGTPTFFDVPSGDPAYPFVEAFVAAGITVGCDLGPPLRYCPDDFVTRRQMAVFFAKALGLYWPF